MTKFGKKFTCWKCTTKFYDLNKPDAKCPKCGADPADDPNKGVPAPPPAAFGDDVVDDVEEDVPDDIPGDDDDEDEAGDEEPAPAGPDEEF